MCIGGKITTVPRLFSEHSLQDENKHQIMNVHTKWNCLIPILSGFNWSSLSVCDMNGSFQTTVGVHRKVFFSKSSLPVSVQEFDS